MEHLKRLYLLFEVIALFTIFFSYSKSKATIFKYFLPYLLFICAYEIGSIENWFVINHTNAWISNITLTIFFLFYGIINVNLIIGKDLQKWVKWLIIACLLSSFANTMFLQGFWKLNTVTILLQFAILTGISCLYFFALITRTNGKIDLMKLPGFWLNAGLLLFCLLQFFFFTVFSYMAYLDDYTNYEVTQLTLANVSNAILYSCLSVSFLCLPRTTSY